MKALMFGIICAAIAGEMSPIFAQDEPGLKDVFKRDFLIGAALGPAQFDDAACTNCEAALIKKNFNSISPENVLKWGLVHPWPGIYNFGPSDQYVEFGVKHRMFIIGHNLVWHNQTPDWVFVDKEGKPLTRDALLERMHDHISTVVGRYKGKIGGWDVVNEALEEDGALRQSGWRKIIGDDYLVKAYQFAHEADPKAQLYYNDFSLENPAKRAGAVALVKNLKAHGVRLTAIGSQEHDSMNWPSPPEVEETIQTFARLHLKVMITELDIDVLPPRANPYPTGLPIPMQQALARRYGELFKVFVKHRKEISRVTFWGVANPDSWLNYIPTPGRASYPLLFGRDCQTTPALDAVIAVGRR